MEPSMELAMVEHDRRRPEVPPGYRFTPTLLELVHIYLNRWITGQPLGVLETIVRHADVYGSHPARLTEEHKEFGHDGNWYFFSVVKRQSSKLDSRFSRCVTGGGTWHNSQRRRAIEGCTDGCARFGFEYRDAHAGKTVWLMEELTSSLPAATTEEGVKVICKVYITPRSDRQKTKVVGSKRPALQQEHLGFPVAEATGCPPPLQPEVGCSNSDGGGMSQAIIQANDNCPTHLLDDTSMSKRLHREEHGFSEAAGYAPPPPLQSEVGCSYAAAAGTSQATASINYKFTPEDMSTSVCNGGNDDFPAMAEGDVQVPLAVDSMGTNLCYDQNLGVPLVGFDGECETQDKDMSEEIECIYKFFNDVPDDPNGGGDGQDQPNT